MRGVVRKGALGHSGRRAEKEERTANQEQGKVCEETGGGSHGS
jgi:hypothetical protein